MTSRLRSMLLAGIAAGGMALATAPAQAIPFVGSFEVHANSGSGLEIETWSYNGGNLNLDLTLGTWSGWIKLFDIWTNETDVGDDDTEPKPISVVFSFTTPEILGSGTGTTVGGSFLGITEWGEVTWDNPATLTFGDGGKLLVELTNNNFNQGLFGLAEGPKHGATIEGRFKLVSAPVSVPEPASLALFSLGLIGLALAHRRRAVRATMQA